MRQADLLPDGPRAVRADCGGQGRADRGDRRARQVQPGVPPDRLCVARGEAVRRHLREHHQQSLEQEAARRSAGPHGPAGPRTACRTRSRWPARSPSSSARAPPRARSCWRTSSKWPRKIPRAATIGKAHGSKILTRRHNEPSDGQASRRPVRRRRRAAADRDVHRCDRVRRDRFGDQGAHRRDDARLADAEDARRGILAPPDVRQCDRDRGQMARSRQALRRGHAYADSQRWGSDHSYVRCARPGSREPGSCGRSAPAASADRRRGRAAIQLFPDAGRGRASVQRRNHAGGHRKRIDAGLDERRGGRTCQSAARVGVSHGGYAGIHSSGSAALGWKRLPGRHDGGLRALPARQDATHSDGSARRQTTRRRCGQAVPGSGWAQGRLRGDHRGHRGAESCAAS